MSKAFIAQIIQESADLTGAAANRAAGHLMEAIVKELRKSGKFTLPSFGTFVVRKTKARKGLNPRTGEPVAPTNLSGVQTNRKRDCPLAASAARRRFSTI